MLAGPVQNALKCKDIQTVRSTVCDCLANVGPDTFQRLPVGTVHRPVDHL